ncbi:NGFI-A-binding protein 1 [Nematostella vectensis]|nr:NGFI-A-binding protein 1 [Nematostella vectensis]
MAAPLAQKECELELFTLLKSANLLDYYQSFIEQGGDDIQQLCDASEDEFKEIIAMVGMSTKPLHVRRLQKSLVDWKARKARAVAGDKTPEKNSSWIDYWTPSQSPNVSRATTPVTSATFVTPGSRKRSGSSSSGGKEPAEKRVVELKLPPMDVIIDWEKLDPERQALIREHSKIYGRDDKKRKTSSLNCHEQMINEAAAQLCLRDPTLLVRRDELFTMARRVVRESGFTYVHGHSRSKFVGPDCEELTVEGLVQDLVQQGKKPNQAQINKLKRLERLNDIDSLLAANKEQQEELARKIDEARSLGQEVNELESELVKLQSAQVSYQLEQKELRKKQRRSERYYSNKEGKDDPQEMDDSRHESQDSSDGVMEDVTFVEDSVGQVQEERNESIQTENPAAVVTEILPSASDSSSATTSVAMQQQADTVSDAESSVRALYTAFMPGQLSTEEAQQAAAANMAAFQSLASRTQVQNFQGGTSAITDPTINALLSLSAKDKSGGIVQGVNMHGVPISVAVTGHPGSQSSVLTTPNITVVMPAGHPLPANMQWT